MKNRTLKRLASLVVVFIFMFAFSLPVSAEDSQDEAIYTYVFDNNNLLTNEERVILDVYAEELNEMYSLDVVFVTDTNNDGRTAEEFADDFYDYNGFSMDGLLLFIDMENREYHISTCGEGIRIFTDNRIDTMCDNLASHLPDSPYDAFMSFAEDVDRYCGKTMSDGKYSYDAETGAPVYDDGSNSIELKETLIFAGIALIIAVIAFFAVTVRYKLKFSQYKYPLHERGGINLTQNQDIFLREHTTSRRIETSSSSGGGSSTHRSSSGRSHGGGGGRF